jgi:hypothetical protein
VKRAIHGDDVRMYGLMVEQNAVESAIYTVIDVV